MTLFVRLSPAADWRLILEVLVVPSCRWRKYFKIFPAVTSEGGIFSASAKKDNDTIKQMANQGLSELVQNEM